MDHESQKRTFCNYLGAKRTMKTTKVGPFHYLEHWTPMCSKTHPGHKNTPKRPWEGRYWRQCTSCGPINWFWAKKTKFESVHSKVCSFHTESANTVRVQRDQSPFQFKLFLLFFFLDFFYSCSIIHASFK